MRRAGLLAVVLSALALLCVHFDLVPQLRGPAPYPPEWQWRHRPRSLARAWPALPFGAALVGLVAWSGSTSAQRRPRRAAAVVIGGAVLMGTAFPLALVSSEDGGLVAHLVRRTASPGYLSYHAVAASHERHDLARFLQDYPARLPGLPMHAATHPPGAIVAFAGLIAFFEDAPGLTHTLDRPIAAACGRELDSCGPYVAALEAPARVAALAGPVAAHVLAVLALLPIAALAFGLTRDPLAAARTAALWPVVPAVALFLPALDPAIALPVTTSLAALRGAIAAERTWRWIAGALLAGAAAAVASYLSYGAPVFLAVGVLAVVAGAPSEILARRRGPLVRALAAAAAATLTFFFAPMALGLHDPWASARAALALHAGEYTARRSYTLWLAFGPLDLALFLGVPVTVGFAAHLLRAARGRTWLVLPPPTRLAVGLALGLGLLFLSGTVRGEVGRLLVPLMPLGLLAGMLRLEERPGPDAAPAAWTAALLMLLDVAMRVRWRI